MISRSLPFRFASFSLTTLTFGALICAFTAAPVAAQQPLANHLPKRIVADYGYWSKYQTPPYGHAEIPYTELTHINHAGLGFDNTGALVFPPPPQNQFIEPELNNLAHAHGVKVLLLLGGDFPGLEASGKVQTLVDNILAFETQYHYDGVDMDWEYPATTGDRTFFNDLMARLRKSNPDYVLSVDVPPWQGYGYDLGNMMHTTDYFNIMMYDCAGPWTAHGQTNSAIFWNPHDPAPYECEPGGSAQQAADIFLKVVPPAQLNMGSPFYGYHYFNIDKEFAVCPNSYHTADGECDLDDVPSMNYAPAIKILINNPQYGWVVNYDPIAYVPYMVRPDGGGYITYDDAFSTYYRTWYSVWDRGLGGMFMWSLDADYDGHSQDLMSAMYAATVTQ